MMTMMSILSALLDTCKPLVLTSLLLWLVTRLWHEYIIATKDPSCSAPLPPGSMGLPFFGETLSFLAKVRGTFMFVKKMGVYVGCDYRRLCDIILSFLNPMLADRSTQGRSQSKGNFPPIYT